MAPSSMVSTSRASLTSQGRSGRQAVAQVNPTGVAVKEVDDQMMIA
jgi:hypothetical protein